MSDQRKQGGQRHTTTSTSVRTRNSTSAERFFQNSFFVVVSAIGAVVVLVVFAMLFAALLTQNVGTDTLSAMLGTGTTLIGTLVGSFLGLRQGQQGRIKLSKGLSKVSGRLSESPGNGASIVGGPGLRALR